MRRKQIELFKKEKEGKKKLDELRDKYELAEIKKLNGALLEIKLNRPKRQLPRTIMPLRNYCETIKCVFVA